MLPARNLIVLTLSAGCLASVPRHACAQGQYYRASIQQAASTSTYSLSVNAPFVPSPNPIPSPIPTPANFSYLIGDAAAVAPLTPGPTITRPGLFNTPTTNLPVRVTAGSFSISGNSGANPLHPTGSFTLYVDPAAGTATAWGLSVSILGGGSLSLTAVISVSFESFRTANPGCIIPAATVPVNIPVLVSAIIAAQAHPFDSGTLTPSGPTTLDFSIPMDLIVTTTASSNGAPIAINPQTISITLTGSITPAANAPITATLNLSNQQVQPGPTNLDPSLTSLAPLCTASVLVQIALASTTVNITSNSTLAATGARHSPADIASIGQLSPPYTSDGLLTLADLDAGLNCFINRILRPGQTPPAPGAYYMDLASIGQLTRPYVPDGLITLEDLDALLSSFFSP